MHRCKNRCWKYHKLFFVLSPDETDPEYEQPSPGFATPITSQSSATIHPTNQKQPANKGRGKRTKPDDEKTTRKGTKKKTEAKRKQQTEEILSSDDETDAGLNDSFEQKSSGTDMPEESIMISPTSSPLSKRDIAYKHKQVWDYIQKNETLYLKILHYEVSFISCSK